MNLIDRAKKTHEEEAKKRKERVSSGKIAPSSLGWCLRRQWYKHNGQPETDPMDFEGWAKVTLGRAIHSVFQAMFPKDVCEIKVETEDCFGYADIVQVDRVIDIKSQSDWAFKWHTKKDFKIKDKVDNWMQVAFYAMALEKPFVELDFVNQKQISDIIEYEDKTENWRPMVTAEIEKIKLTIKGKIPEPAPRLYGGKECDYCQFRTVCGFKPKETKDEKMS